MVHQPPPYLDLSSATPRRKISRGGNFQLRTRPKKIFCTTNIHHKLPVQHHRILTYNRETIVRKVSIRQTHNSQARYAGHPRAPMLPSLTSSSYPEEVACSLHDECARASSTGVEGGGMCKHARLESKALYMAMFRAGHPARALPPPRQPWRKPIHS
ncbi:hypothetical protein BC827DRAFT_340914 [Russula dissimulans]|nr:hypothetical protein BC827DRAFT_340914 [Russula dissimulans]